MEVVSAHHAFKAVDGDLRSPAGMLYAVGVVVRDEGEGLFLAHDIESAIAHHPTAERVLRCTYYRGDMVDGTWPPGARAGASIRVRQAYVESDCTPGDLDQIRAEVLGLVTSARRATALSSSAG